MKDDVYIVAVSGGVDSVVLLDLLVTKNLQSSVFGPQSRFIVAHFDHGIREESGTDVAFVESLAKSLGLQFELGHADLGKDASEAEARKVRYNFLRQCCKKYNTSDIVVAHHRDDQIETAIINIIRGTSWRGLASFEPQSNQYGINILRPLLEWSKNDILEYAKDKTLQWVEDATNQDQSYLRNKVRLTLLPQILTSNSEFTDQMITYIEHAQKLKVRINEELENLLDNYMTASDGVIAVRRYDLIMWPESVAREVIYMLLRKLDDDWDPTRMHIQKALLFAKSSLPNKELQVSGSLRLISTKRSIQFKKI